MVDDIYVKSLEKDNDKLRQRIADYEEKLDKISDNPLEESLRMLISISLKQQKALAYRSKSFRILENSVIRIMLPRQSGISTSIVNAAASFFSVVNVLLPANYPRRNVKPKNSVIKYHTQVSEFTGIKTSCVIIDPWYSIRKSYPEGCTAYPDVLKKIECSMDTSQPHLLILAG